MRSHALRSWKRIELTSVFLFVLGVTTAPAAPSGWARHAAREESHGPVLAVRMTPSMAFAPATVRALVQVAKDPDNRLLRIVLDGDSFYGSSDIQLDGEMAPRSHFLQWNALPPGHYCVEVVVFRSRGNDERVRRDYHVLGEGVDPSDTASGSCMKTAGAAALPLAPDSFPHVP